MRSSHPEELSARVRARFPDLGALPTRPTLDTIVEKADPGLRFADGVYCSAASAPAATSGLPSRLATAVPEPTEAALGRSDRMDRLLAESIRSHSFLALGIAVHRSDEVDRAVAALAGRFDGHRIDVTGLIIDEMQQVASQTNLPWDLVRSADAAAPGSRDARGLHALVERVLPKITDRIDEAVFGDSTSGNSGPVILTELSPLARYGHLGVVARWSDLAAKRARATWVVVPQLSRRRGALVDSKPLQLGSNGQFVDVDPGWLTAQEKQLAEA